MKTIATAAAFAFLALTAAPAIAQDAAQQGGGDPIFTPSGGTLPFSEAVQVGDVLYLSGAIGTVDGRLPEGGIEPETRAMMERIGARLEKQGLDFSSLIKCTVFLADMGDWPAFNAVYRTYFEEGRYPARSALGISGLALGAAVEMECLAHKPG